MQFSVTFRHMEGTSALKEYAEKRVKRFAKYFADPISCHVTMSTSRYNHRADVTVQLHNGFRIAAHETTENMYSSLDIVSAKIERQVRRYKDKLRHHKVREMPPTPVFHSIVTDPVTANSDAPSPETPQPPPAPEITSRERLEAGPMSLSEAVMQLNLLHEQFYVYRDESSGDVNVIYRHSDGGYGLIETGQNR